MLLLVVMWERSKFFFNQALDCLKRYKLHYLNGTLDSMKFWKEYVFIFLYFRMLTRQKNAYLLGFFRIFINRWCSPVVLKTS